MGGNFQISNGNGFPATFRLSQNYPNPFNPETVIEYELPSAQQVELAIYDILSRKIKTLVNKEQKMGHYQVKWDGTDNAGNKVGSAIYLHVIKAGEYRSVKKMVLME